MHNESAYCIIDNATTENIVVYGSEMERVATTIVLLVVFVVTILAQGLVIVTIVKAELLHMPQFIIMLSCCIGDISMASSAIFILVQFYADCIARRTCQILSLFYVANSLALGGLIGFMAVERYIFFCHPLKYPVIYKTYVTVLIVVVICLAPFVYLYSVALPAVYHYDASVMACIPDEDSTEQPVYLLLSVLCITTITVLCVFKIWWLSRNASYAPALPSEQEAAPTVCEQLARKAKKVLRMILLVSGSFWGTSLPSVIVASAIMSRHRNSHDLNARVHVAEAIGVRICSIVYGLASSLLNPFIYYYSRPDFREAFAKLVRIHRHAELEPPIELQN